MNVAAGLHGKRICLQGAVRDLRSGKSSETLFTLEDRRHRVDIVLTAPLRDGEISTTEGLTNLAIAKRLGITEEGVKRHVNTIMDKLGADCRAEAVAIALRKHLLKL